MANSAPPATSRRCRVERMEISGYGASMFSHWLDQDAAIAQVSQASFDVLVGRTAHEVVQVRSILYPFGVHVVRTITFTRSSNGYVFRSDSGWKAESDGFYDFSYKIGFDSYSWKLMSPSHMSCTSSRLRASRMFGKSRTIPMQALLLRRSN